MNEDRKDWAITEYKEEIDSLLRDVWRKQKGIEALKKEELDILKDIYVLAGEAKDKFPDSPIKISIAAARELFNEH